MGPLILASSPALSFMPTYYAQTVGFPLGVVGIITACGRLFDIGSDAAIGFLADYTQCRFGRRRIWILIASPFLLLAMWSLYVPSAGITPLGALCALAVFFISWTGVVIPYQAQAAEITTDYRSRSRIVLTQGAFIALASIAAIGLPFLALDHRTAALRAPLISYLRTAQFPGAAELLALFAGGGSANALQFGPLLRIVAAVTTAALILVLLIYLMIVPDRSTNARATAPSLSLRLLRSNGPLHRLLAGHFLIEMGTFWSVGLVPFYLAYVAHLPDVVLLAMLAQQSIGLLATPAWSWFADHCGRARTLATAGAMQVGGLISLWFVPSGHEGLILANFLWLGIPFLTIVMVPYSLGADAADYLTWKTGHEAAAVHMSAISLITKFGVAMSAVALIAVSAAGFDPARGSTSGFALQALRVLSTLVPAAIVAVGSAIVLSFPITASRHRAIRSRLQRRARLASRTSRVGERQ